MPPREEAEAPARVPPDRRRPLIAAAAVVALLVVAALAYSVGRAGGASSHTSTAPSASPSPSPTAPTPAQIYAALRPSVVSIFAQTSAAGSGNAGTGVIIDANADILTARHVVAGALAITVVFADGTQSTATIASDDPATDIATLTPATLPSVIVPTVLGSAARLAVGDPVMAIGDQLGLTGTATQGVVSGLGRSATAEDGVTLTGLIQFDAAVNHGSSGGPLINGAGQTVGIVVALANPTSDGTFIGVGFAVPIATAAAGGGRPIPQ